jgi:hypothetical protein
MLSNFWSFAKEPESRHVVPSPSKSSKSIRHRPRRKGKRDGPASMVSANIKETPLSFGFSDESISVCETKHGVEVALDWNAATVSDSKVDVVNFSHYMRHARKIQKCQFSMNYPIMPLAAMGERQKQPQQQSCHRIPLSESANVSSLDDDIFLLQSHMVRDELTSIEEEMTRLDAEIQALEDDRMELEHDYLQLPSTSAELPSWDFEFLLKKQKPSLENVQELQRLRGRCWTVQLQSMKTRDTICNKLCSLDPNSHKRKTNKYKSRTTVTATTQVSYLCLLPGTGSHSTFFMHTDSSESHGYVPPRLFARMKKNALHMDMLTYLSTGPNGSYFCSFSSGHVFWGISDPDFDEIVKEWPVYRVAFGETKKLPQQKRLFSWIVVSRDGRVAFKNLPLRLTNLLNSRLADESAPAEIALGSEGAYFIRFLNGTIDYCLPSHITDVCNFIMQRGGKITNILLHPQLSKEFIVRHTEMK